MKTNLVKFLKVFLIAAAAILILLLLFGVALLLDWPWWMGFFLGLVLAGLVVGGFFVRKVLLRRREQSFVQEVIEQDESRLRAASEKERDEFRELQERWKGAVEALWRSHLRKFGNPLYVLPWYLVMGESGSGKTTAIGSARLASPFADFTRTSGISGTRNCDWWFFEQAILIDTAGRYAIPVDEGRDKEEWQQFLNLLVKYRKKEPIHGLIVTVAADKLLEAAPETLEEDGRTIRRRIEELMRVLGTRFPVYLLVTKCDLVQGMMQFCDRLPEKALDQPMGYVNQDLSPDSVAFLDRAMGTLDDRLRNLRLLLVHRPSAGPVDPGLLLFPEEFGNLRRGLAPFVRAAFRENPYQETPLLRGLFASSGRQEGTPFSHFLKALGMIGEKEVLPGTSRGLFLHDFFARVLPGDRKLLAPTRKAVEWRLLTRNLGIAAWVLLGLSLCGLLSFSFVKNLRTVREVSREFAKAPPLQGDVLADMIAMDRFREEIRKVEDRNRSWWVPRFGLRESLKVEAGLKERFCRQFQEGFLTPYDRRLAEAVSGLGTSVGDDILGQYVLHLVRRANLLRARLDGDSVASLRARSQPAYVPRLPAAGPEGDPAVRNTFGALYFHYLVWRQDPGDLAKEVAILQSWLRHLLALKGGNIQWLVAWVDRHGGVPPTTLGDFWEGEELPGEKVIPPSFTRQGKETIDAVVREIETALPDPALFADRKTALAAWYRNAAFAAWRDFAAVFPRGVERLKGEKEWQQAAARMDAEQSPFFVFLDRVATDLEPLTEGGNLPPWLQQVYRFQMAKATGARASAEMKGLVAKVGKVLGKGSGEPMDPQSRAVRAYQDYQAALAAITPAAGSRSQAVELCTLTFSEDPATGSSPFFKAYTAAAGIAGGAAEGGARDDVFGKLVAGPAVFLWGFVRSETACHLQGQWEEKVLAGAQGAAGPQAAALLLGQDGPVWKFVKGDAAPFVGWNVQRGYHAKEVLGGAVPVDASLFGFLSRGARASAMAKASYTVTVRGLPTEANPGARRLPESTTIELQCADGVQRLANYNYPTSRSFQWSPDACGDVTFRIRIGDLSLTRKYAGSRSFSDFLRDFPAGRRTFRAEEFPAERAALQGMGVKTIRVSYQFGGDAGAVIQVGGVSGTIPRSIVRCWEQ
jgi:type VI secretion system protein ImpL